MGVAIPEEGKGLGMEVDIPNEFDAEEGVPHPIEEEGNEAGKEEEEEEELEVEPQTLLDGGQTLLDGVNPKLELEDGGVALKLEEGAVGLLQDAEKAGNDDESDAVIVFLNESDRELVGTEGTNEEEEKPKEEEDDGVFPMVRSCSCLDSSSKLPITLSGWR